MVARRESFLSVYIFVVCITIKLYLTRRTKYVETGYEWCKAAIMKVWIVMAKMPEIEARSIDRVFDSKEKANQYVLEHKDEELVNINDFELNIEEWEVE